MPRVLYRGTCLQCLRPYQVIAQGRCPACRAGRAQAARAALVALDDSLADLGPEEIPGDGVAMGEDPD